MAEQSDPIEMILQDCLEKIQNGQSTLEGVLAEHPDLAEELRPSLEAALWFRMHKATLAPRPGFIAASNRRVLEQIKREQLAKSQPQPAAGLLVFTRLWQLLTGQHKLVFQAALAFVLLFVMVAGSGGVAYASQDALPGDLLYRVKISLEKAQVGFAQGEAAKAELQIRLAQRRLGEIQALISQDRLGDIPKTISMFEDHINQAIHHMISVRDQDQDRAAALVANMESVLREQVGIFTILAENAPPSLREQIDRIILVSNGVIGLASESLVETDTPAVVEITSTPSPSLTPVVTQFLVLSTETLPVAAPTSTVPYYELLPTATDWIAIDVTTTPTPTLVLTVVADEEENKDEEEPKLEKTKKPLPVPPRRPIKPPGLNK